MEADPGISDGRSTGSGPVPSPRAGAGAEWERLRDLEGLTAGYASFGVAAAGLGLLPTGLGMVAGAGLAWAGRVPEAAAWLAAVAPLGVALALAAHGRYQRQGRVLARSPFASGGGRDPLGPRLSGGLLLVLAAAMGVATTLDALERSPGWPFTFWWSACLLAGLALLLRVRGRRGFWLLASPVLLCLAWSGQAGQSSLPFWLLAAVGLAYTAAGLGDHLRYLRLERRLAALQEGR